MTLSSTDQDEIQRAIEVASLDERSRMKAEAETALSSVNYAMGQTRLDAEASKAAEIAIEILVRLEALEKNLGWWFRTKRRVQLVQMYLGG